MASSITQGTAIQVANEITAAMKQFAVLLPTVKAAVDSYSNNGLGTVLPALPTVALNDDGTYAASPDPTPVPGNVIDPRATAAGWTETQSSFNYGAAFVLCEQFIALFEGQAVSQQTSAPALLSIFNP